jgi:hypothetical protein
MIIAAVSRSSLCWDDDHTLFFLVFPEKRIRPVQPVGGAFCAPSKVLCETRSVRFA